MTTELTNSVQIIEQSGKPAFAVIPWDEFQALVSIQANQKSLFAQYGFINRFYRAIFILPLKKSVSRCIFLALVPMHLIG